MKNIHLKYLGFTLIFIVALVVWQKNLRGSKNDKSNFIRDSQKLSFRGDDSAQKSARTEYVPYRFFDNEPAMNEFKKIEGNGLNLANFFNHDIQSTSENFGFHARDKIYEDKNKVEFLHGKSNEFLVYRINHGKYQTQRNEVEARQQLLIRGVGSINYGNSLMRRFPTACYYFSINRAYQNGGNSPSTIGLFPPVEIEIYPCTFTYDELWQDGGSEYLTHEGFLVISSVGQDYELDANEITKHPVKGKIRRNYSLVGVGVNENADNERERFDKKTANPGVKIWEDVKVSEQ